MFTLSDKQRVLNQPLSVKVFSAPNPSTGVVTERTTSASITATDKILVDGFGHFDIAAITDIHCRRARAAVAEVQNWTVPAGTAIPVGFNSGSFASGDAIEVKIEMDTARYDSTLFVQDRLGGVKPMVFTTAPIIGAGAVPTAAEIASAIVTAYTKYLDTFTKGFFQLSVVAGGTTSQIRTVIAKDYEAINVRSVSVRRVNSGIGTQPFIALAKASHATNAAGFQGEGLGKFLEESIRMNTPITSNVYGVDNAETQVDLRGSYTAVYFTVAANYEENLSTVAADVRPLSAKHDFVLFLNEATCNGLDSAIGKLAAAALLKAGTNGMTATVTAAPLPLAAERTEVMVKADGSSVATVAAFIA
jgi:hypothetical protein